VRKSEKGVSAEGAEMKVEMRKGPIVRVIDGPFRGFRGEVEEVDEQTAKVALQVFGRVTPVDLALGQIELVPEDSN
jgi:transcriptional antiterminator NusG